jgi:iron(III) transport system substrate-binding protein
MRRRSVLALPFAVPLASPALVAAQERLINLYSSRHYDTDRALYEGFTAESGIRTRLIEGDADHIIEVRDIWSFARDLKAPNPNWSLVAVRAGSA